MIKPVVHRLPASNAPLKNGDVLVTIDIPLSIAASANNYADVVTDIVLSTDVRWKPQLLVRFLSSDEHIDFLGEVSGFKWNHGSAERHDLHIPISTIGRGQVLCQVIYTGNERIKFEYPMVVRIGVELAG